MRKRRILAAIPLILVLGGCDDGSPTEPAVVVLSVTISPSSSELVGEGSTTTLTASVQTDGGSGTPTVTWSSSAPQVVQVAGSGASAVVTAVAVGEATITATAGETSGTASISVVPGSHALTVTVEGDGTLLSEPEGLTCTGAACEGSFEPGTEVVLTPVPGSESRFVAWAGECGDTRACAVTMDQPRSLSITFEPRVEDNGLSPEINELVPDTLIASMMELGMPIHRGPNPPSLEGVFHVSPLILLASTVPDPLLPGHQFPDLYVQFSEQDNEALTVTTDYVQIAGTGGEPATGEGLATFVVGSDDAFSAFAAITVVFQADTLQTLEVYSGRITEDGVDDFHKALFMLDNAGRSPPYIPNGTGRVMHDGDGLSPRVPELPPAAVAASTAADPGRTEILPIGIWRSPW